MYAVIKAGGKQYRVKEGEVITTEKLDGEIGTKVDFEAIALGDGDDLVIDKKKLAKAKVTGEIVDQFKDDKVIIFKFKKRKGYKRLRGHRQDKSAVRIDTIAK